MGFLSALLGIGRKVPKVHYRPSTHDKLKERAKSKPQSYWDAKKRK